MAWAYERAGRTERGLVRNYTRQDFVDDRVKLCLRIWGESMRMPDGELYCTLLKPDEVGECKYLNTDQSYELTQYHTFYKCEREDDRPR